VLALRAAGPAEGPSITEVPVARTPSDVALGYGRAWVASSGARTISRIDAASAEPTGEPIDVGFRPSRIAVGAGGVWVTSESAPQVARVDPDTREVGDPIRLEASASAIAAGFGAAWLTTGEQSVVRVDARSQAVTRAIPVGREPSAIAVGPNAVWAVSSDFGTLVQIDPRAARRTGPAVDVGRRSSTRSRLARAPCSCSTRTNGP